MHQIRTNTQLRPIWLYYRNLLDCSLEAGYECRSFSTVQVQALRQHAFTAIKQHIREQLG